MKKRFLFLIMMVVLVVSLFCITASAATYSGYCGGEGDGTNLTWTLTDGDLTISGQGAMKDCGNVGVPWGDHDLGKITTVTIGDGVTTIGDGVFGYYSALDYVSIGNSVRTIGEDAFTHCEALASVTLPESVTSIGDYAFSGCDALTSITIPEGVTTISETAFSYCDNLKIKVDSNNHNYSDLDGMLLNKDKTVLITCPNGAKWYIPDGVTTIGNYAFYRSGIYSVRIPDSVKTIGDKAFYWCENLTFVTLGNNLETIGASAFEHCLSLISVTIPDSVKIIGDDAFYECSDLTSVTIGENLESIGKSVFVGCDELNQITVKSENRNYCDVDGILFNKDRSVLVCCPSAKEQSSYAIPDSVTTIGDDAFNECDMTCVTMPDSVESIGCRAFQNCKGLTSVAIGNGVKTIGDYAFEGCSSLTSVVIPDSVESIGRYAFQGCNKLTSAVIGDGVKTIGDWAFYWCVNLASVTIGENVETIGIHAFQRCRLAPMTLPDSVEVIGDYAFFNCNGLTFIAIPDSVKSIGDYAFKACYGLTSVTLGDGVTSIGKEAFYQCRALTSVSLPDSVEIFGDKAFYDCDALTTATIGDSVTTISNSAFENCDALTTVTIGNSVTTISNSAFCNCDALTAVMIGDSVTTISNSAFYDCDALTTVPIGGGVTTIGTSAFSQCSSLTSVSIPNSVETLGGGAFYNCDALTAVMIGDSVTTISGSAFYDCDALTAVTIGDSVTTIGYYAFYDCDALTAVTIGDSVTTISNYAFEDCDALTTVTIGDSVTTIDFAAFSQCYELTLVHYIGTIEQWNGIYKGAGNWELIDAERHYMVRTAGDNGDKTHSEVITCPDCELTYSDTVPCTYEDGVCTKCGGEEGLKYKVAGTTMALGNELKLNIVVAAEDYTFEGMTAYVIHHAKDGDITYKYPRNIWVFSGGYFRFSAPVKAMQMTDQISLEIRDAEGNVYNNPYSTSVRDYVGRILPGNGTAYSKTLMVDMVNYGAAAQTYFDYKTDDLANANLTEAQKALATGDVTCGDDLVKGTNYLGSTLNLKDNILLNIYFKDNGQVRADKMYAMVSFTGYKGNVENVKTTVSYNSNGLYVVVDQIVLGDSFEPVTVTVYNADGTVYGQATDSVEGYIGRKAGSNALYMSIIKFAYAGREYMLNK